MKRCLVLLVMAAGAGCIKHNTCEAQYRGSRADYRTGAPPSPQKRCPPTRAPREENEMPVLEDPR